MASQYQLGVDHHIDQSHGKADASKEHSDGLSLEEQRNDDDPKEHGANAVHQTHTKRSVVSLCRHGEEGQTTKGKAGQQQALEHRHGLVLMTNQRNHVALSEGDDAEQNVIGWNYATKGFAADEGALSSNINHHEQKEDPHVVQLPLCDFGVQQHQSNEDCC